MLLRLLSLFRLQALCIKHKNILQDIWISLYLKCNGFQNFWETRESINLQPTSKFLCGFFQYIHITIGKNHLCLRSSDGKHWLIFDFRKDLEFIQPFIFCCLSGSRLCGQQRCPDLPLAPPPLANLGEAKAFPSQPRDIVSPQHVLVLPRGFTNLSEEAHGRHKCPNHFSWLLSMCSNFQYIL